MIFGLTLFSFQVPRKNFMEYLSVLWYLFFLFMHIPCD